MKEFLREVLMNVDMDQVDDGGIGALLVKAIEGFKKPKVDQPVTDAGVIGKSPPAQPGQINVMQSLGM